MADSTSLRGIASSMAQRAAGETKKSAKGVIGNIIEGVTGQIEDHNKALEENTKHKIKQIEINQKLTKTQKRITEILKMQELGMLDETKAGKKLREELEKLELQEKKLGNQLTTTNRKLSVSTKKMSDMDKKGGILSNGMTILAGKVGGAALAFSAFGKALDSIDKRMKFAGASIADAGVVTGDFWDTTKAIKDEALKWNTAINDTNSQMTKFGYSLSETNTIMMTLRDGLRLTTADQGNMAEKTGQLTKDIGQLSVLLRVSTDDIAAATVQASKKFGKGTKAMTEDLAMMYHELTQLKQGSEDVVLNIGDLTREIFEGQAAFQGYNLSLRDQARLMGSIVTKAQEQGATYEQSMKAAKGLVDIIAGGAAPEWAKYIAGRELVKEMDDLGQKVGETAKKYGERMQAEFGFDPNTKAGQRRKKNLENLTQEFKKTGSLSSTLMIEQMMRGTDKGMEAMFKQIQKHAKDSEGQQLLKRIWGLDDAAATAAVLAIRGGQTYRDFAKDIGALEDEELKRAPPTADDILKQTEGMVGAINVSQKGIVDGIKDYFHGQFGDSPVGQAIIGIFGLGTSTALQIAQIPGAGGLAKKAARALPGVVKAAPAAIAGVAGGAVSGLGAGAGAIMGTGATVAGTAAAAGGGAAGVAAVAAPLLAAGAAGVALGTGMRYASDALAEWTGVSYLSIDKISQWGLDNVASVVDTLTLGLIDFRNELPHAEQALKDLDTSLKTAGPAFKEQFDHIAKAASGSFEKGSAEMTEAMRLTAFKMQDLETPEEVEASMQAYAKRIQEQTGEDFGKILTNLQTMMVEGKKLSAGPVAAMAEVEKKKAPPVVTVTKLTQEQKRAVSQQVATKLAPEVAEMSRSMFGTMAQQSTEYWENLTSVSQVFWMDSLPKMAELTWDSVAAAFEKKLDQDQKLAPEVAKMPHSMFETMAKQSTEFYEDFTDVSQSFWSTTLPKMSERSWDAVSKSFEKKLDQIAGPAMIPVAFETGGGGAGGGAGGGMGGMAAAVGQDGSITIKMMIPRDAIDASNRVAHGYGS